MKYRQSISHLFVVVVVCWLVGCEGGGVGPQVEPGDIGAVKDLISPINDYARSRDTFEAMYTEGKAPDDKSRQKLNKYGFYINEDPVIEGNKATITVDVEDPDNFDEDTRVIATLTWIAVKEGDEWKLEDTPVTDLP